MNKNIQKFSPLTEASFYILLSLDKPIHGYGIIKKVEEMTDGKLILAAGTLYGVISKLVKHKLIRFIREDKENKNKKLYEATDLGKRLIEFEIKRLQLMVENGIKEVG